jgi:hypothetical protein
VKWSWTFFGWLVAYLAVIALVVASVSYMRSVAMAVYGTPQAQSEWDTWREGVKELEEQPYPVKRRVPQSTEPPALVLMRDYFRVCLTIAVVLSTVLFGTFMVLLRGAVRDELKPSKQRAET